MDQWVPSAEAVQWRVAKYHSAQNRGSCTHTEQLKCHAHILGADGIFDMFNSAAFTNLFASWLWYSNLTSGTAIFHSPLKYPIERHRNAGALPDYGLGFAIWYHKHCQKKWMLRLIGRYHIVMGRYIRMIKAPSVQNHAGSALLCHASHFSKRCPWVISAEIKFFLSQLNFVQISGRVQKCSRL